jgi:bifunctional DNase/RNase
LQKYFRPVGPATTTGGKLAKTMPKPRLVLVSVEPIRLDMKTHQYCVVLRAKRDSRFLSFGIGVAEANAIALAREGTKTERPTTAELTASLIRSLGGHLDLVAIHSLVSGVYFAGLSLRQGDQRVEVDARPSDAVALALRLGAPVYVANGLLQAKQTAA